MLFFELDQKVPVHKSFLKKSNIKFFDFFSIVLKKISKGSVPWNEIEKLNQLTSL